MVCIGNRLFNFFLQRDTDANESEALTRAVAALDRQDKKKKQTI